jgi:hypothetical protein
MRYGSIGRGMSDSVALRPNDPPRRKVVPQAVFAQLGLQLLRVHL